MHPEPLALAPALWAALTLCVAYLAGFLAGRNNRHLPPGVLA